MKTYYTLEETPLKFHKFVHYVLLPLRFLVLGAAISDFVVNIKDYNVLGIFSVFILTVLPWVLIIIAFIGLFKWKRYAFYCLFSYCILDVLSAAYILVIRLRYISEEIAFSVGRFFGVTVVASVVGIYYWNRRKLFIQKHEAAAPLIVSSAKEPSMLKDTNSSKISVDTTNFSRNIDIDPTIKFCRKCGKRLLSESIFCSYCGTKAKEE